MDNRSKDGFNVQELLMACPYNSCNPKYCQLYDLRKLSVRERMMWESYLSNEARDAIYKAHVDCFMKCQYQQQDAS